MLIEHYSVPRTARQHSRMRVIHPIGRHELARTLEQIGVAKGREQAQQRCALVPTRTYAVAGRAMEQLYSSTMAPQVPRSLSWRRSGSAQSNTGLWYPRITTARRGSAPLHDGCEGLACPTSPISSATPWPVQKADRDALCRGIGMMRRIAVLDCLSQGPVTARSEQRNIGDRSATSGL